MLSLELPLAVLALLTAVAVGTVVHELLHAGVLRAAGVSVSLQWLGDRSTGTLGSLLGGALAAVQLRRVPEHTSPWTLRIASLSPLVLVLPLLAIPAGFVADPFAGGDPIAQAAVLGWMACALPSPADFSMAWHAEDVVDGTTDGLESTDG